MSEKRITYSAYSLFLMIALFLQWYLFKHDINDFHIVLNADGGNITSFIAGWLYPERFTHDLVLHDTNSFAFYLSGSIPFTLLFHLGFGLDLGTAFSLAYAPLIFIQLVGFFLLGKRIFNNGYVALSLSLLSLLTCSVGAGEFWGLLNEPLSRQWHNTLFPYFILLLISWVDTPRRWFWLFALAGVSVYLHPVGAPALAFIVGFVLFTTRPSTLSWYKHILYLGISCFGFFLTAAPFTYLYLNSFPALETLKTTQDIASHMYQDVYLANINAWVAFKQFFIPNATLTLEEPFWTSLLQHNMIKAKSTTSLIRNNWNILLLVLGSIGFLYSYQKASKEKNKNTKEQISLFIKISIGLIIVSFVLPFIDQTIAKIYNRNPVQYDLARNIRFLIPILYIGLLYLVMETNNKHRIKLCLFCVCFAFYFNTPTLFKHAIREYKKGVPAPVLKVHKDSAILLEYLKKLPPQKILPLGTNWSSQRDGLAIRYIAHQSVVYSPKDKNALAYSNSPDYWRWITLNELNSQITNQKLSLSERSQSLTKMIKETDADYLYLDNNGVTKWIINSVSLYGDPVLTTPYKVLVKLH